MRHIRAGGLLGLVAVSALAVVIAVPVASARTTPARANLVKAVGTASAQAKKLIARSRACPAAAAQRTITTRVRTAQTTRLTKASPTSLRLRQLRITTHTTRLAVALTKCSGAPNASAPGARELSSGSSGASGAPGTNTAGLPLDSLGQVVDATSLLDGGILPAQIPDLGITSLATSPACATIGAVCVGVDPEALSAALGGAVAQREQQLPVLGSVLDPLLSQVDGILAAGGADSLIDVERNGDSTFTVNVVPGTPLAGIVNLLVATGGLPDAAVATVQVHV